MHARPLGILAAGVTLALAACGGGGGGGGGPPAAGDPASLAAHAAFSADDVRHLLSRTHFGGTPAEEDAAAAMGVPAFVDAMLAPPAEPTLEAEALEQLWHVNDALDARGAFPAWDSTPRWWLELMTRTAHPFQDELALFWHDHFATSAALLDVSETHWMVEHLSFLRAAGAGNLEALLLGMARSPMMLRYLDGVLNTAAAPNENFAREFWELFTLGVDNGYTQADIVEAARAFTGYRTRVALNGQVQVEFDPLRHDAGPKTFLGATVPGQAVTDDYAAVVHRTLEARPVAELVARRLLEHFVRRDPADALVAAVAARLRTEGYELRPVLRALFLSQAFYAPSARGQLVRSPVQQVVGFARQTGLVPWDEPQPWDPPDGAANTLRTLDAALLRAGHRVSWAPSVNGWPQDRQWLSAQGALDRVNAVLDVTSDRAEQEAHGMDVLGLVPGGAAAAAAVDALAARLRVTPTATHRALWVQYLDTTDPGTGEVPSPFAAQPAAERRARLRGLLWLLAQHPTFFLR